MEGKKKCWGGRWGNNVELVCKTLQMEQKRFYLDLNENRRGRYLKISEKTSTTRWTIIVPLDGIARFLDLFDYYVNSGEDASTKELRLDHKVFSFAVGESRREGRHLKITEACVSGTRSTIIVPSGNAPDEGWVAFRNILAEINQASGRILPNQNSSHSSQPSPATDLNGEETFVYGKLLPRKWQDHQKTEAPIEKEREFRKVKYDRERLASELELDSYWYDNDEISSLCWRGAEDFMDDKERQERDNSRH